MYWVDSTCVWLIQHVYDLFNLSWIVMTSAIPIQHVSDPFNLNLIDLTCIGLIQPVFVWFNFVYNWFNPSWIVMTCAWPMDAHQQGLPVIATLSISYRHVTDYHFWVSHCWSRVSSVPSWVPQRVNLFKSCPCSKLQCFGSCCKQLCLENIQNYIS